jgi:hypothetical protein
VRHADLQAEFLREPGQLHLPQPQPTAIGTSRVGGDEQPGGVSKAAVRATAAAECGARPGHHTETITSGNRTATRPRLTSKSLNNGKHSG